MGDFEHLDDAALADRVEREADLIEGQGTRACGGWCVDYVTTALLRTSAERLRATRPSGSRAASGGAS